MRVLSGIGTHTHTHKITHTQFYPTEQKEAKIKYRRKKNELTKERQNIDFVVSGGSPKPIDSFSGITTFFPVQGLLG